MNFNTPAFLLIFFPAVVCFYFTVPAWLRVPALIAASVIFYAADGLVPCIVLGAVVGWTWAASVYLSRYQNRLLLAAAIALPLMVLAFFKYTAFFAEAFGLTLSEPVAAAITYYGLPAGISFYTFHAISYVTDIYRRKIERPAPFLDYALYVIFFPQLIAGPIIRFNDVGEQFRLLRKRLPEIDYLSGIKLLVFGLFYKTFFADILHFFKDKYVFGAGAEAASYSILSYSMVIYYDFWGYSLMAMGMARILGVALPRNFDEPYKSRSPKEFWRRWHISLSLWLRDYVYIPLGGNKRYMRNIAIVFALCGLWHGAGWNFIVWGLYHGLLVIVYRLTQDKWDSLPEWASIALTFVLVSLAWPLFYLSLGGFVDLVRDLGSAGTGSPYAAHHWLVLLAVVAWTFFARESMIIFSRDHGTVWDSPVVLAMMAAASLSFLSFRQTFIYFQF